MPFAAVHEEHLARRVMCAQSAQPVIGVSVHSSAASDFLAPIATSKRSVVARSAPMRFSSSPLNEIPASPADRSASGEELAFGATPQSRSKACVPSGSSDTVASLLENDFSRSAAIRLGGLNFGNGARAHVPSEGSRPQLDP